ncbi:hypothetical protein [Brucella intermedia]|uniref:hypothetical protein n=1 Tax=Brucella intermedia TaxID=94625 RepID=UPI002361DFBB|nr:hypothetical protein [Brucella intermedia]
MKAKDRERLRKYDDRHLEELRAKRLKEYDQKYGYQENRAAATIANIIGVAFAAFFALAFVAIVASFHILKFIAKIMIRLFSKK